MNRKITLALQGGGSHGAFTWGVLDRLLEDGRIRIEGISGASAGAMNAVALAYGFALDGRDGARQALQNFWETVARAAPFALLPATGSAADGLGVGGSPALNTLLFLTRFLSPAQLNPFDLNPLRRILLSQIDFERLRRHPMIKLFIAATEVASGRLRLFRNADLTLNALLASACLPTLHRPIEIDGKSYWDGALAANPPLYPLVHKCSADDVVVVLLHPWRKPGAPIAADDIANRMTEIGFTSTFLSQFHGLMLAKHEAEVERDSSSRFQERLRRLNVHIIDDQELMRRLTAGSKLNTHPSFIHAMRDDGRRHAQAWLDQEFPQIGARSSRHTRFLPDHSTMFSF